MRDGTAEPVSREKKIERRRGEFDCTSSVDHEQVCKP